MLVDRLRLALDLHETAEAMMRQRIRRQLPGVDDATLEQLLVDWLRTRPGAEFGDAEGRPGVWPRSQP